MLYCVSDSSKDALMRSWTIACTLLLCASAIAQEPAQNDSTTTRESPIVRWSFEGPIAGVWHGDSKIAKSTLTPPQYPNLPADNHAAYFSGKNHLQLKEAEVTGNLRFDNGSSITLEAWVNPEKIA